MIVCAMFTASTTNNPRSEFDSSALRLSFFRAVEMSPRKRRRPSNPEAHQTTKQLNPLHRPIPSNGLPTSGPIHRRCFFPRSVFFLRPTHHRPHLKKSVTHSPRPLPPWSSPSQGDPQAADEHLQPPEAAHGTGPDPPVQVRPTAHPKRW